jgi:hypothetical protein
MKWRRHQSGGETTDEEAAMKNPIVRSGALCTALLATLMGAPAFAETPPGTSPDAPTPAAHVHALDREGKPIYGCELMSETEISGLRSLLFSLKDPVLRDEARAAHRKAMDKRAAERGLKIDE